MISPLDAGKNELRGQPVRGRIALSWLLSKISAKIAEFEKKSCYKTYIKAVVIEMSNASGI